jgi:GNAT superfamily N-acetyltransferase
MLVERVANLTDLGFINSCILYGARKGHYSFDAENPRMVAAMKREVQSVLSGGPLLDTRNAMTTIFTMQDVRVGMLIMCELAPNATGYEIYALSVAKNHQGKGYGCQILDSIKNRYLYDDVHARCLPVSEKMKKLLKSRGFVYLNEDGEYETYVKYGFNCHDMAEPLVLSHKY